MKATPATVQVVRWLWIWELHALGATRRAFLRCADVLAVYLRRDGGNICVSGLGGTSAARPPQKGRASRLVAVRPEATVAVERQLSDLPLGVASPLLEVTAAARTGGCDFDAIIQSQSISCGSSGRRVGRLPESMAI